MILTKAIPGPHHSLRKVLGVNKMKRFLLDDTGLELSEYAVAVALVAIAVVGAFTALGEAIASRLNELVTRVSG
jgi:Flp pilus assembly pilin Flp